MSWLDNLILGLENKYGKSITIALIVAAITVTTCFLAFPAQIITAFFHYPLARVPSERFVRTFIPLSLDPWHTRFSDPRLQAFRHRILGPLIAWCVGLRGRKSILVTVFPNPIIYFLTYVFFRKRTQPSTAFLTSVVLSLTLACLTSQFWAGYQDSLASLFLLLSLFAAALWASAAFLFVGMLADERILSAAFLILVWHGMINASSENWLRQTAIRAVWLVASAAGWCAFMLAQKHFYGTQFHEVMHAVSTNALIYFRNNIWAGWWYALRAGWLFPMALIAKWVQSKRFMPAIALAAATLPILLISLEVQDISRVASIAFPAFLIGVIVMYRAAPLLLNHLLVAAVLIQVFSPMYTVVGNSIRIIRPLPAFVGDRVFGRVPAEMGFPDQSHANSSDGLHSPAPDGQMATP